MDLIHQTNPKHTIYWRLQSNIHYVLYPQKPGMFSSFLTVANTLANRFGYELSARRSFGSAFETVTEPGLAASLTWWRRSIVEVCFVSDGSVVAQMRHRGEVIHYSNHPELCELLRGWVCETQQREQTRYIPEEGETS
ncbi:hypothetical protein CLV44_11975 [Marinobacterium halophilum]|uniref:Uncharacterized protein n=1 Tax=Marinobacterium halophilum TaxID=267374 RepID=A0A2P8ERZ0_9GAMM|nr:hypothetical protein CLV44_11975 [Marinobacterium halophilum]